MHVAEKLSPCVSGMLEGMDAVENSQKKTAGCKLEEKTLSITSAYLQATAAYGSLPRGVRI